MTHILRIIYYSRIYIFNIIFVNLFYINVAYYDHSLIVLQLCVNTFYDKYKHVRISYTKYILYNIKLNKLIYFVIYHCINIIMITRQIQIK